MNLEILAFIKAYYSQAYTHIYPLIKYAILHDIVVTFNSYDEYSFLIKFQSLNPNMNLLIEEFLGKYTGVKITIEDDKKNRFYEIIISLKPDFKIERFRLYREEEDFLCDDILEYTQKENIFMVLYITDFLFTQKEEQKYLFSQGYLYKFKNPELLSESIFLKSTF